VEVRRVEIRRVTGRHGVDLDARRGIGVEHALVMDVIDDVREERPVTVVVLPVVLGEEVRTEVYRFAVAVLVVGDRGYVEFALRRGLIV